MGNSSSSTVKKDKDKLVAILGAGPAGVFTARSCLEEGLEPVIFEQSSGYGGQWERGSPPANSGVFDSMKTNSAWFENCVSDTPASNNGSDALSVLQTPQQLTEYMERIIRKCGLKSRIKSGCKILQVTKTPEMTYDVKIEHSGAVTTENFYKVVVCTGRYQVSNIPDDFVGMESFRGTVMTAKSYRKPEKFAWKKVLVVGGGSSAVEIAADLLSAETGNEGPTHVTICPRTVKHYVPKEKDGQAFLGSMNRMGSLKYLGGSLSEQEKIAQKIYELEHYGRNVDYGIPAPSTGAPTAVPTPAKVFEQSKEGGKLTWKVGSINEYTEKGVKFEDGTSEQYDAVIHALGYQVNVDFLSNPIQDAILAEDVPEEWLDLYKHTWHPELPNLAFVGMVKAGGPSFALLDIQSRWVAANLQGWVKVPPKGVMLKGIEAWRAFRTSEAFPGTVRSIDLIESIASELRCMPNLSRYPEHTRGLLFGPCIAAQYRLEGHGATPEVARAEVWSTLTAAGMIPGSNQLTHTELAGLKTVAANLELLDEEQQLLVPHGISGAIELLEKESSRKMSEQVLPVPGNSPQRKALGGRANAKANVDKTVWSNAKGHIKRRSLTRASKVKVNDAVEEGGEANENLPPQTESSGKMLEQVPPLPGNSPQRKALWSNAKGHIKRRSLTRASKLKGNDAVDEGGEANKNLPPQPPPQEV
ncbi:unnamed protein product [Chrysoparadoxa australica]